MSLSDKQWEFLQDIALLIQFCERKGVKMTAGEAWRTQEQQEIHIEEGNSWVEHSKHQDRLAMDFNFFINGGLTYEPEDLQFIGDFWESLREENTWGGNWAETDTPHFERRT